MAAHLLAALDVSPTEWGVPFDGRPLEVQWAGIARCRCVIEPSETLPRAPAYGLVWRCGRCGLPHLPMTVLVLEDEWYGTRWYGVLA
jgi:hypothetical protein